MDVETSQLCEIVSEVQRGGRPEGRMGIRPRAHWIPVEGEEREPPGRC